LRACLNGFRRIEFPRDQFEIIVVDDGSPVFPEDLCERFRDEFTIKRVSQANAGPAAARNLGARHASGVNLAFIDDDCIPAPGWLSALNQQLIRLPDCLVGGSIVNRLRENPYSTTSQMIQAYVYDYYHRRPDTAFLFNSNNIAMSTSHFQKVGGFDRSFRRPGGEDYDFCHRWHVAGFPTAYVPDATVYHTHPLTFSSFSRQHFNYGRGLLMCRTRMGSRSGRRLQLEAVTFYVGIFRFALSQHAGLRGWVYLALVCVSQAATVAGAFAKAITIATRRIISQRRQKRNL
jgi:GT2 family glycosyltransferase